MRVVRFQILALVASLARNHRGAEHEIAIIRRAVVEHESKHVRGVVPPAVSAVERATLPRADDPYRETRVGVERFTHPAPEALLRWHAARPGRVLHAETHAATAALIPLLPDCGGG